MVLAGCNLTVGIFPFEQCPPRPVAVEIQPDPEGPVPTFETRFHSTAGCTIVFDVRQYRVLTTNADDPRWEPIGGLDYELRIEPEGPLGRLEQGVLPEDGRLTVPTVAGNTSVWLTVFVPDSRSNTVNQEVAAVFLD